MSLNHPENGIVHQCVFITVKFDRNPVSYFWYMDLRCDLLDVLLQMIDGSTNSMLPTTAILKLAKAGYDQKGSAHVFLPLSLLLIYSLLFPSLSLSFPPFFSVSHSFNHPLVGHSPLCPLFSTLYPAMNLASSNGSPSPSNNPLSDLIRTEKAYIDTLKIIDTVSGRQVKRIKVSWFCCISQELAPLLQNGAAAISDDLLDSVHDILVSNTRFYQVQSYAQC